MASILDGLHAPDKGTNIIPESSKPIAVYVTNTAKDPVIAEILGVKENSLASLFKVPLTGLKDSVKKPKISVNPTTSDMLKVTSLDEAVPTGFILIHNDLLDIVKVLGESKKGSSTSRSMLAGTAAGLASGAVQGIIGAFNKDPADEYLAQLASDSTMNITPEIFADDQEILQIQKKGFKEYLKAYYTQKSAALIGSVGGDVLASAIEGVGHGLISMFSKDNSNEVNKLVEITDTVLGTLDTATFVDDPEVAEASRKRVVSYLKSYYISQTAAIAAGGFIEGVSGSIGTAVHDLVANMFGKEQDPSKLQLITEAIMNSISPEDYLMNPEVAAANKEGVVNYLKSYYKVQTFAMQADGYVSGVATALGGVLTGFVNRLLEDLFGGEKSYAGIQSVVDDLISELDTSIDTADLAQDDEVISAYKLGIVEYLKSYYKAQAFSAAADETITAAAGAAGAGVRNFFSGLFGKKEGKKDNFLDKVQSIIDTANYDAVIDASSIQDIQRESLLSYISAYYEQLIKSTDDLAGIGSSQSIKSALTSKLSADISTGHLGELLKTPDLSEDSITMTATANSIRSFVSKYFESVAANTDFSKAKLSEKDFTGTAFESGINDTFKSAIKSIFKNMGNVDATLVFDGASSTNLDIHNIASDVNSIKYYLMNIYGNTVDLLANTATIANNPNIIVTNNSPVDPFEGV